MSLNRTLVAVLGIYAALTLSSCGGSPGGGVAEFKTVRVSATALTTSLESDVLTGNTCPDTTGTFVTDSVDVRINSTLYPGLAASSGLPVAIDSYTVQFIPDETHSFPRETPPALAGLSGSILGQTVSSNGTITIPIGVAPQATKIKLVDDGIIPACSGTIHAYFAIITLSGVEIGTGTRNDIGPVSLNVAFEDSSI